MILHYIFETEVNGHKSQCVRAVMHNCSMDAVRAIKRMTGKNVNKEALKAAHMPCTIQRTVVCDPSDEFDAALGLRMADQRLLKAYNDARNKAIERYKKECKAQFDAANAVQVTELCIRPEKATGDWYETKAKELMG